jgi:two-component system sensor histidine kinase PhcS
LSQRAAHEFLYKYSGVSIVVAILLILAGSLLDHFYYPQHFWDFFVLRLVASACIGIAYGLIKSKVGKRFIKELCLAWAMIPQIMINFMIAKTGGPDSIYFVGLTYALTGLGVLCPLTLLEATLFTAATLGLYVAACVVGTNGDVFPHNFWGNLVFLSFFVIVLLVIAVYGDRSRRQNIRLQMETKLRDKAIKEGNRALTETKLQLIHSEKMASLGTLSAGLLHELNNPINYSAIAIRLAADYLKAGDVPAASEVTQDAIHGIDRVKAIVADLKTFAYQRASSEVPLDSRFNLLEAVRVAGRLTAHERAGFNFDVNVPEDLWVKGDAAAISSVFINLLSNSAYALEISKRGKDGRITIRTVLSKDERRVMVFVSDNGIGISADVTGRVFEPFFSTRSVGAGLGLGLSISYTIVQRHGSRLSVNSIQGEYTEFNFELEIADERK